MLTTHPKDSVANFKLSHDPVDMRSIVVCGANYAKLVYDMAFLRVPVLVLSEDHHLHVLAKDMKKN